MRGDAFRKVRDALAARGAPLHNGRAACPAHGGTNPNLSVRQGREGVVVHCHSEGCSAGAVAQALGLSLRDLFDEPYERSQPFITPSRAKAVADAPIPTTLTCLACGDGLVGDADAVERFGATLGMRACRHCVPVLAEALERSPENIATTQTANALGLLTDGQPLVRYPWRALDAIHGPLASRNVYLVAAVGGGGKTTFIANLLSWWYDEGVPVMIMPLELSPDEWRVWFACVRVGVAAGDALSGALREAAKAGDLRAQYQRTLIGEELERLRDGAELLHVWPDPHLTLAGFRKAVAIAADAGVRVIVVDHMDHLAHEATRDAVAASREITLAMKTMALEHDVTILATSQLNMELLRGDRLGKYSPPQVNHLLYPGTKQQVATGIIGLFRPRRDDAGLERLVRSGVKPVGDILMPNTMGCVVMKQRHYGQFEQHQATLRVERGVITDHIPSVPEPSDGPEPDDDEEATDVAA